MRQPSLFVRSLRQDEARRLRDISKRSRQLWRRQRAAILLASDTQMAVKAIARLYRTDESQVRRVIREFNEEGFSSLDPVVGGGRPRRIDQKARDEIVAVALARPQDHRVPVSRWSLRKLAEHLGRHHGVSVSAEHLRRVLKEEGITYQRTRTWKSSPDPDYEVKKNRILGLYRRAERGRLKDAVVVSFDECGPLSLRPWAGSGWFVQTRPKRMRATFHRPHGVSYFFGAYDVGADRLTGDIRRGKNSTEVLRFFIKLRARYDPGVRIYLVLDNLSTHRTKAIRSFCAKNRITLVFTPTYASHLNRIECHFAAYKDFVIGGTDFADHNELVAATRSYLRYRNHRRRGAPIRQAESRRKVA